MTKDETTTNLSNSNIESIGLVTERTAWVFKNRPYVFWASLWILCVFGTAIISINGERQVAFVGLCLSLSAGFITVPVAFRYCHSIFFQWAIGVREYIVTDDNNAITEWHKRELRFFEGSRPMLVSGLVLGSAAFFAFQIGDYFAATSLRQMIFGSLITFASAFLAGIGVFAMICASRAVWRLGTITGAKVHVDNTDFGILQTGQTLVRCWLAIGLVWSIYTLSAILGMPGDETVRVLQSPPVLLLAVPTLPLILGSFFISQFPLHRRMIEYKRTELRRMDRLLEKLKLDEISDLTPERQLSIEFLQRQRVEVIALPEWPFRWKSLLGISTSALSAVFPLIFNPILTKFLG